MAENPSQSNRITRPRRNPRTSEVITISPSESTTVVTPRRSSSSEKKPVTYRIGITVGAVLCLIAAYFDILELVLDATGTVLGGVGVVIGYAKDVFTNIFFPVVFLLLGAPFWKGKKAKKKMITMITAAIISFIPEIGALMPETLIAVFVTIYYTRAEDRGKNPERELLRNFVRSKRVNEKFGSRMK